MIRILTVLSIVWFAIWLLIDVNGNFPLNDDWQYAYAVKSLLETGELNYRGQFSPIVLVQVYWGALFCKITASGFSFTALRWSTLVLVPFMLAAILKLGMMLSLSKRALVVLGIGLYTTPLMMALSPSFMSDVPFAFLSVLSIFCYWYFVEHRKKEWFVLALFLSVLAFYIRQPGMVLPIVFGVHYWWTHGRSQKQLIKMLVLFVFAIALLLSWEALVKPGLGLSDHFKSDMDNYLALVLENPYLFIRTLLLRLLKSFVYLGFFSLPLLPFIWPKNLSTRKLLLIGPVALLFVIASAKVGKVFPFGGNIFYNFGLGPELLADTYTLGIANTPAYGVGLMYLLHFISASWALVLFSLLVKKWRLMATHHRSYLQLWVLLALCYFPLMSITSYYDRYVLLPLLLLWPLLLVDIKTATIKALQWIPIGVVMIFSIAATHDYFAWNKAKLTAFDWLQSKEISIQQMDAGYELNGWYNYGAPRILNDETSFWWVTDNEYLLTFGAVPNYEPIHKVAYTRWLWVKEDFIYVLQRQSVLK